MRSQQQPKAMKPLPSLCRTRFSAAVMLLVWLLTLGAGIANACLLHADHAMAGHGHNSMAYGTRAAVAGAQVRVVAQGMAVQLSQRDVGDQQLQTIPCRIRWATLETAVHKQPPRAAAASAGDPVLVTRSGPFRALPSRVPALSSAAPVPRPGPPVFIRFLRLAL